MSHNAPVFTLTPSSEQGTASAAEPTEEPEAIHYLLVTDQTNEVLTSGDGTEGLSACRKLAGVVRRAGGKVTVFKSLKF